MNFLDLIIIVLVLLYALNGIYRGFIPSLLNTGGFFLSWISAFIFYPFLSKELAGAEFFSSLRFYMEGAEKIGDVELAKCSIDALSPDKISEIIKNAKLPTPFSQAISDNISNKAFEAQGIETLGDYFDTTIYYVIINIISILIIFLVVRIALTLLTNAFSYAYKTPELVHLDHTLGGVMGLIRGFFSMYMLFAIIPVLYMFFMDVTLFTDIINGSASCSIFYSNSVLLRFISGNIG